MNPRPKPLPASTGERSKVVEREPVKDQRNISENSHIITTPDGTI